MKVAFYKGTRHGLQGLYSRGVRLVDHGPYSHCELIFADGMAASASYLDGGVRFKTIEFDLGHWDFVEVPWADEAKARAWFEAHVGCAYDLLGNLHFVFGVVAESPDDWFCNEAIAAALGLIEGWRNGPNGFYAALVAINNIYALSQGGQ